jgi:hypothetical protein
LLPCGCCNVWAQVPPRRRAGCGSAAPLPPTGNSTHPPCAPHLTLVQSILMFPRFRIPGHTTKRLDDCRFSRILRCSYFIPKSHKNARSGRRHAVRPRLSLPLLRHRPRAHGMRVHVALIDSTGSCDLIFEDGIRSLVALKMIRHGEEREALTCAQDMFARDSISCGWRPRDR